MLYEHYFFTLLNTSSVSKTKACLLSVASSKSGAWLGALPVPSLGSKLDDESLRIALGLHLGVPIVVEHIHVFVVLMLMFLVLIVCLAGIVVAVFHGTLLSIKLFVVLWCLGVYLLFWSL